MLDEPFSEGSSYLHRADPRTKIACALAFAVLVAPLQLLPTAGAAFCLGLGCILAARLPLKKLARRLAAINLFILFLWVFLPFSTPGTPIWHMGPLTATDAGLHAAALVTLKSNAIICMLIALATTSGITETGHALAALGVPDKFAMLLLFTWRYLHVIAQEYQRLQTAARIRGFIPRTSRHTYATYANLIGMVLVKSWDRSERVRQAMLLRGFNGRIHRLHDFRSAPADRVLGALMLTATLALLCTDILIRSGVRP